MRDKREDDINTPISIIKIQSFYECLSYSEKLIADYFISHLDDIVYLTITAVAQVTKTSEATVVRTCKKLGYKGFQDFKITIAQDIVNPVKTVFEQTDENDDCATIFNKKIGNAINTLQYTLKIMDNNQLEKAAMALRDTSKVVVFGNGSSASVAIDAAHKFMLAGLDSACFSDSHMQIMAASNLKKGDVAICITHSGSSKNLVDALRVAGKSGATTITITNYRKSPITEVANIVLHTASEETKHHIVALSSRIAQLAIIDALYICVSQKKKNASIEMMDAIEKALFTK